MLSLTSFEGIRLQALRSPAFLDDPVAQTITQIEGANSLDDLNTWCESLALEFTPQTATWSLYLWEMAYGITPKPGATDSARRDVVMARYNASNRCNGAFLKAQIEQQSGGRVVAITQLADYTYEIGITNRTKDLAALNAAIDDIIPAHLLITIIEQAMSYTAEDAFNYTEAQWDSLALTWDQEEVYNGTPAPH